MRLRFALGFGLVIAACLAVAPPPAHASTRAELVQIPRDSSCTTAPADGVSITAASLTPVPLQAGVPASQTLLLSLAGVVGMTAAAKSTKREIDGAVVLNGRTYTKGQEDALARVLPQKDIDRLLEKGTLKGDWSRGPKEPETVARTAAVAETESTAGNDNTPAADEPKKPARKRSGAKAAKTAAKRGK